MNKNYEIWAKRIREWKESGLSQKKYCNKSSISFSTFHYWRKKLKSTTNQQFVELKMSRPAISSQSIIILELPNGIRIQTSQFTNVATLKNLVSELKVLL